MVRASGSRDGEPGISIPLQYHDDHWRDIFRKYDRDGDGKISYLELKAMIRGHEYTHDIPLSVAHTIMKRADLDNSGYLEFPEFIAVIHRKDMQGVFGHLVQRYVHSVVPGRPTPPSLSPQQRTLDLPDGIYEEEYKCWPPPIAMIVISIIEIMLFLYDVVYGSSTIQGPAATLFIYNPYKRYEGWRYITYMFVHVGYIHLIVNLLVQILLGLPLEMVHSWWRVLIIYLAGVLAGSLGTSVSDPMVHLAGASGGVYALITAHLATIILNWKQMEFALLQSFIFVTVTTLDVGHAIWRRYLSHDNSDNIGYVAHIAGALAGLLVGINVLRNLEVKTWEKVVWWLSIFTYSALMIAAILWNVLNSTYYYDKNI